MDSFTAAFYVVIVLFVIFGLLAIIDVVCLVILWRWRIIKRNEARRQRERARRKKRPPIWEDDTVEHKALKEEELDRFYGAPW